MIAGRIARGRSTLAVYTAIGGASACVEWAVFSAAILIAPTRLISAAVAAFLVATYVNYWLCVCTIFASKTGSVLKDITGVYCASAFAFAVNLSVFAALARGLGFDPLGSKIAGTGVGFLLNFAARRLVLFSVEERGPLAGVRRTWGFFCLGARDRPSPEET